jgi:hypothetical protein
MIVIHIDLKITSEIMNEDAMNKLRMQLRRNVMSFIFDAVNEVANREDMRFNHRNITIAGDIVTIDG